MSKTDIVVVKFYAYLSYVYLSIVHGESDMLDCSANVMIVDDVKLMRKMLIAFLQELGYVNFVEACDGREALQQFESNSIDIIFLDIVMPDMNGIEALRTLKSINNEVPVIMLSSIAESETVQECIDTGASGYLNKPLNKDTGPEAIRKILNQLD